jgi:hypothetical protein
VATSLGARSSQTDGADATLAQHSDRVWDDQPAGATLRVFLEREAVWSGRADVARDLGESALPPFKITSVVRK